MKKKEGIVIGFGLKVRLHRKENYLVRYMNKTYQELWSGMELDFRMDLIIVLIF